MLVLYHSAILLSTVIKMPGMCRHSDKFVKTALDLTIAHLTLLAENSVKFNAMRLN